MAEKRDGGATGPTPTRESPTNCPFVPPKVHPSGLPAEGALLQWMSAQEAAAPRQENQAPQPLAVLRRGPGQPAPPQGGTTASEASVGGMERRGGASNPTDALPTVPTASPGSSGGSSPLSDDSSSSGDTAAAAAAARRRQQWRQLQALGGLPPTADRVCSSNISSASAFIERVGLADELASARAERTALTAHGAVLARLLAVKNAEARALAPQGASSASEATATTAPSPVTSSDHSGGSLRALLESDSLDADTLARLQMASALCEAGNPQGDPAAAAAAQQRSACAAAAQLSPDQLQRLQIAYRQCRRRVRAAKAQSSGEGAGLKRQIGALQVPPPTGPSAAKDKTNAMYIRPWHDKAESHLSCTSLARQAASASRETLAAAEDFELQFLQIMGPQVLALIYIECAPHAVDCMAVSSEILGAAGVLS